MDSNDSKTKPDPKDKGLTEGAGTGKGGLLIETDLPEESGSFDAQLEQTLSATKQALQEVSDEATQPAPDSWERAREIVEQFRPVPWFIWRLSSSVLSKSGQIGEVSEGMTLGLRRLLFAAGSDDVLGAGKKINNVKEALKVLKGDVVAASSVIHAVCRRLSSRPFERIWKPILDDAVVRARIGFEVGLEEPSFGPGRGMLAGFAGRCGLATLISSGELPQAQQALDLLAAGQEIREVGAKVYECDPLQVSAMILSASGCGRDAAFGTVAFASAAPFSVVDNQEQLKWLAAFTITEFARTNRIEQIDTRLWAALNILSEASKDKLLELVKKLVRHGHTWSWIL